MIVTEIAQEIGANVEGLDWSLAQGGNVFEDDLPQAPDVAAGVYHVGGDEPDSLLEYDRPTLQITVRGDTDPQTATVLWGRLYSYLHGLRNKALPGGTWLVSCLAIQSAPVRVGPDENGRHRYNLNLQLEIRNPTAQRT